MSRPDNARQAPPVPDLARMRRTYHGRGIDVGDLAADWLTQFQRWFDDAVASGLLAEPNAMVLATASAAAIPSARTVLLKGVDSRGLTFYTNRESRKGRELAENPRATAVFSWPVLSRQVIAAGAVRPIGRDESRAYFHSRPRGSQLGAAASPQSRVIASRADLDQTLADVRAAFPEGTEVPLPEHWGGFRLAPTTVEFWQGATDRLHDRLRYRWDDGADAWMIERLAP
ncbi:MAG TPA: pyridoxamine 5'-phosphate oxidase [Mycobacteriales bacterium]|nr:pyridoxamine 5'-phosphate oxidase [Mycobacteriales bacterium]